MNSKLIVYPTDFSNCAKNAMPFAIAMGKVLKCKIRIVHSVEIGLVASSEENPSVILDEIIKLEAIAESKLVKLKEEIQALGIECEYALIQGRTLFLKDYIEDLNPLMIVMGTIGNSGLENKIFGSQTSKIIRNTKSIVLAVPTKAKFNNLSKIVFATDYHTKDKTCIEFISKITKFYEASLRVIHICEPEENIEKNQKFLSLLESEITKLVSTRKLHFELLSGKDADDCILEFLEKEKPDMLCLVTRKRNFIERVFEKSLAKKMVNYTNTPILVFS